MTADFNEHYICQQGLRIAVLWKDIISVNNKSIASSIKKYSTCSRKEMEILSLDSLHEYKGIGTLLLNAAIGKARDSGLERIMLITTNDNLPALRFYQKRGFDLVQIRRNALEQARKIKPEIPLIGMDGIPIKHEIELELIL